MPLFSPRDGSRVASGCAGAGAGVHVLLVFTAFFLCCAPHKVHAYAPSQGAQCVLPSKAFLAALPCLRHLVVDMCASFAVSCRHFGSIEARPRAGSTTLNAVVETPKKQEGAATRVGIRWICMLPVCSSQQGRVQIRQVEQASAYVCAGDTTAAVQQRT